MVLLVFAPLLSLGQEPTSARIDVCTKGDCVSISEPASVRIEDLYAQADLVASIRIISGDTESYSKTAIYKAEVVLSFKGTAQGAKIFVGPYTGLRLGDEYLAFLRSSKDHLEPIRLDAPSALSFGSIQSWYRIMYQGYSIMETDYRCIFDGKTIPEECDYGVRLSTEKVLVPKALKTFPDGTSGVVANIGGPGRFHSSST